MSTPPPEQPPLPSAPAGISSVRIEDEMRQSYLEYAMSVIIGRALPDVRDGLKPVHRRVLYSMQEQGNHHNRPYRKSARVVGDVIGKYHPHGESAVYDAIVRMAQPFSMRHMLVDGQGNFGSVDGDDAAAMRYTEVRMTRLAHEIMTDLDKDTVEFQTNYDESLQEPTVLPARYPNLLVNGGSGIAVGMASNIPPHNLGETLDTLLYYMDHRQGYTLEGLMAHLPGPDFPTSGEILGRQGIREAYTTGRGVITVRARAEIEEERGRERICVHELPYMVNKARLMEKIAELVRARKLEGVADLRDESDRRGMRMVVDVRRGHAAQTLLNNLFKLTAMQGSFGVILLAVVQGQPRVLPLAELLEQFLQHRIQVVERRTRYDLARAERRIHLLEGLRIALEHLESVIEAIKQASSPAEARESLRRDYSLSDLQAREILDLRLARLTALEQEKIQEEYTETQKRIAEYRAILAKRERVLEIIREEALELRERYAEPRRTRILDDSGEFQAEDLIIEEEVVITITRGGYVKRSSASLYRAQRRGGRGRIGMNVRDEDLIEQVFSASTHDTLLVFTSLGKSYALPVHALPAAAPNARGRAAVNLFALEAGERIRAYMNISSMDQGGYVVMATQQGMIKKCALSSFSKIRRNGIRAIHITEQDQLITAALTRGDQDIFLATERGISIRFSESEVRPTGRTSRGVIGIRLHTGDRLIAMTPLFTQGLLLTVSTNGYGKCTLVERYPQRHRGGQGIFTLRATSRVGQVAGVLYLEEPRNIVLVTGSGRLIRLDSSHLRATGRVTQGVRLIQLNQNEQVVGLAPLFEEDPNDVEEEGALPIVEPAVEPTADPATEPATDPSDSETP